jgi:Vitamin K-dependent gamma-carboxylase
VSPARLASGFGCDTRSLAALRIALGLLLIADLAWRLPLLTWCFSEVGAWPVAAARDGARLPWSLYLLSGSQWWTGALFSLAALCAVALTVGWQTRVTTIVSWALLVSLQQRNTLVLNGGDSILRLLLFWGAFLPLGARWSLDARRSPARAKLITSGATFALVLQVAFIYVFNALYKTDASWRTEGTAIADALRLETYATPFGESLLASPDLLKSATKATWWFELLGPLLAFMPWRQAMMRCTAAFAFMAFHAALLATLRIGIFPIIGMAAWLPFLPAAFWDRITGGTSMPAANATPASRWWVHATPVVLIAYVFIWNTWGLFAERGAASPPPAGFTLPGHALMLHQKWKLFAPPLSYEGWTIIAVTDKSGRVYDALTGRELDTSRPAHLRERTGDARRRKFLDGYRTTRNNHRIRWLAAWAEREWRRAHPDSELESLSIHYLWERVADRQSPPGNWLLYEYPPGPFTEAARKLGYEPGVLEETSDN